MKKFVIIFSFLLPVTGYTQHTLSLEMAIDSALKNNFGILIARNNAEINKINNNYGMAGGLPVINAGISDNATLYNIHQENNDGTVVNQKNSFSNNLSADVSASITLFNGLRVWSAKKRLTYLQEQGFLELNMEIQNTIAAVMIKYYDIIRQESYLKIIRSTIDISEKKSEIIKERKNVGLANDADVMQAEIDLNLSMQSLSSQQLIIKNLKTELLQLMSIGQYSPYIIQDSIIDVDTGIKIDSVLVFIKDNYQYLSADQQIKISEQLAKEERAARFPSLRLNTSYDFSYNQHNSGNMLLNQNFGPYAGLALQIPIFNGGIYRIRQKTAQLTVSNARLQKESLLNDLSSAAIKTFQTYENAVKQAISQQASFTLSEKLVDLVLQKFQLNHSTILDLKAAQQSFENSAYLLVNLQYQAKIAEIELKRLTCSLR
ncbi:MAG TPA: TolC family protein [Bacteroidales bacterium]|nr:TolC family protein [Bacteroidales bacterium]